MLTHSIVIFIFILGVLFEKCKLFNEVRDNMYKSQFNRMSEYKGIIEKISICIPYTFGAVIFMLIFSKILMVIESMFWNDLNCFFKNVNSIESIIITYFTAVLASAFFGGALQMKEYSVFQKSDIMKRIHLFPVYVLSILSVTISLLLTYFLGNMSGYQDRYAIWWIALQVSMIMTVISGTYIIFVIIMISVSNFKVDFILLKKLY